MPNLRVDILIPCYNEEDVLPHSIPAMLAQDYSPKPNLMFVDDGSTDKTVEIIQQYIETSDRIKLFKQNHRGPAQARNFAASQSTSDILVFNDADMIPDPHYVSALVSPIIAGVAKGTFTSSEKVGNVHNYWAECWSLAGGCKIGKRFPDDYPKDAPAFRALLKKEFSRVGGYSDVGTGGVGEDLTLSKKLGYLALDAPLAICYHDNPSTMKDFMCSAAWYGKGWYAKYGFRTLIVNLLKRNPLTSLIKAMIKKRFYYALGLVIYDSAVIYGMFSTALGGKNYK
jgi:glycosyltransferase involved in cell wall biosynthesis